MARKAPMENLIALKKLEQAGVLTAQAERYLEPCDEYSTNWGNKHRRYVYGQLDKATGRRTSGCYIDEWNKSYMIPLEVWKTHINPRFKPQFHIGDMVRVNQHSKRDRVRNKFNQDIGVSQDFKHLGIGSGKEYMSEDMREVHSQFRSQWAYGYTNRVDSRILIGNQNYSPNILAAYGVAKSYRHRGIKIMGRASWQPDRYIEVVDLMDRITLSGDGIFGPKQLINGYVTNIFVHFLMPRWKTKREARYQVTLDTGAQGVWTNDYMTRVYDTDYDLDESLMSNCECQHCKVMDKCTHTEMHMPNEECYIKCPVSGMICTPAFDYTNLFDTTHGVGLELEDEND